MAVYEPARRKRSAEEITSGSARAETAKSVFRETRIEPMIAAVEPIMTLVLSTSYSRLINHDRNTRKTSESCRMAVTTIEGATASEASTNPEHTVTRTDEQTDHSPSSRRSPAMSHRTAGRRRRSENTIVAAAYAITPPASTLACGALSKARRTMSGEIPYAMAAHELKK